MSSSSEKMIKIRFPDGKLDQVFCQNDLRALKLKICQLIRIPFDCIVLLNIAKHEIANSQEFKSFEFGNEYEVIDLRQLLGNQKKKFESQERELQNLKQQSQKEIEFLKHKVSQLEQFIASINNQQNLSDVEWQNKINSQFEENSKLNDTIQAMNQQIDNLNVQLYQKINELQDTQSQVTVYQFEIEEGQEANERLIKRQQELKDELNQQEEELQSLKAQNYQFQQDIQQFSYQYQMSQQEIYNNYQKIQELEQTLLNDQEQNQEELKKIKKEKKQISNDYDLKVDEINNLNSKVEKLNFELREKQNIIQKIKNEKSEQESQHSEILSQLNEEKDNLQQINQSYQNKLERAMKELKQSQSTIESLLQDKNSQGQVLDNNLLLKHKFQIENYQDKIDDLELQMKTLQKKLIKLEENIYQLTQENKQKDLKLDSQQQSIDKLTSNLKEAEINLKVEKQNYIDQEEKQKLQTKEKLKQKQEEISVLEGQKQNIQQQLDNKNQELILLQNNLNELMQKQQDSQIKIKKEVLIRDEKIVKLNQQLNGTVHFRYRIDRLVENMYDTKVYIGSNKENLSIEKFLMENQSIPNLFLKDTVELKFQAYKVVLEQNQLKQKIYQDSNLEFTNCYNFIPQGEISGLRTKTRTVESNVDRIFFYNCTNGILQNKVLLIRELIKVPQNKDQEFQYMITQGGGSAVSQFLLEEFYQLIHDSKDRIAHYNSLSAQKIVIPENLQFQEQIILKYHDDATNIDRYYNAYIINVQLKNNRYDFIRYNGGHTFVKNSDFAIFIQVFSFFTIWKTNKQLAVTYIQGIENQFFDPIVSTFDGFFNVLDQGNLEIRTFESLFTSSKNNYKADQLLKCLGII